MREIFILGLSIATIAMFLIIVIVKQNRDLKEMAIKQECAHYNPIDGQFEWLRKDKQ